MLVATRVAELSGATAAGGGGRRLLPGWPFSEIDHVLVGCGPSGTASFAVRSCELVHSVPTDGVWASDHAGLVVDLAQP